MTAPDKSSDPGTDTRSAATPSAATGDNSGRQFNSATHVQISMLLVERDRRAANELVKVMGMSETEAAVMVDAFARSNRFEALGMLYAYTGDKAPFRAMRFLERHGYWPVGAPSESATVDAINCEKCRRPIESRSPCWFDVEGERRRFWHAGCRP